jgi:hypothetical protein
MNICAISRAVHGWEIAIKCAYLVSRLAITIMIFFTFKIGIPSIKFMIILTQAPSSIGSGYNNLG